MRFGMLRIALGNLAPLLYAGCMAGAPEAEPIGTTEAAPAERPIPDKHAVLRLEIEPGHTVTFHEPAPGSLSLVERMVPNQSFVLDAKESSDALRAFERRRDAATGLVTD